MRAGKKILLFLFIIFLLLDIGLLFKLRSLLTSPSVEIVNQLPFLALKTDRKKLLALLEESGFLQDSVTFHFQKETNYRPKKIILVFNEMTPQQKGFIQAFQVNDKQVAGYDVDQTADNYRINFYFSSDYLNGLDDEDLSYVFRSFPVKAILYLGKIHQKKQRLNTSDLKEINLILPDYLKKYDFIQAIRN